MGVETKNALRDEVDASGVLWLLKLLRFPIPSGGAL